MWIVMRKCLLDPDVEVRDIGTGMIVNTAKVSIVGLKYYCPVFDSYDEAWSWEKEYDDAGEDNIKEVRERIL